MSDAEWDEEEGPPLPCPIRAGPGTITWSGPHLPDGLIERSWSLARLEEPHEWFAFNAEMLRGEAWDAVTNFDLDHDCRLAEIAGPIYMAYRDLVPPEQRAFFIDEIEREVVLGHCRPDALAIMAFVENEALLVARAAMAYTDARGVAEQNPMPAVDLLLQSWDDDTPVSRAGTFLGLMLLGCPAILDELRPLRYQLTDEEVSMICDPTVVGIYETTIDFMLEWLEEAQAEADHGKFTMLATAVTPSDSGGDREPGEREAADWHRLTPPGLDEGIPDHWYFPIENQSIGRHLAPRLRAIAIREVETRVMPAVLEAYGLDTDWEAS